MSYFFHDLLGTHRDQFIALRASRRIFDYYSVILLFYGDEQKQGKKRRSRNNTNSTRHHYELLSWMPGMPGCQVAITHACSCFLGKFFLFLKIGWIFFFFLFFYSFFYLP
ncbi:hypothetical protein I7I50_09373 [Histoplasma capsulatum G186AR]|uniref:Uncharacterized protein n=1 Tax=Ajellomyces capsulatus TaxID=5037 RepID=A0A8H7YU35_AJECA|nr:hypothetical protein I7I52_06894 [Histoplasma capsulatum]QSS74270.1 hypothetical protein I7I50_09373 [Histoplasma capsulatum G186AR]